MNGRLIIYAMYLYTGWIKHKEKCLRDSIFVNAYRVAKFTNIDRKFVGSGGRPVPPPLTALPSLFRSVFKRANLLVNMKHGMARLDSVWGVGGGQWPVKTLVRQVCGVPCPVCSVSGACHLSHCVCVCVCVCNLNICL